MWDGSHIGGVGLSMAETLCAALCTVEQALGFPRGVQIQWEMDRC